MLREREPRRFRLFVRCLPTKFFVAVVCVAGGWLPGRKPFLKHLGFLVIGMYVPLLLLLNEKAASALDVVKGRRRTRR